MTLYRSDEPFVAVGGSMVGREHARLHRNNQDAVALAAGAWTVAVVADGCSAGRASEVGARVGAAFVAARLGGLLDAAGGDPGAGARALGDALAEALGGLAGLLGGDRSAQVADHLLFGFLAAAVGPERACVIGLGDGVYSVNGAAHALDPGPENAPPYVGYRLLGRAELALDPGPLVPVVHADLPTAELASLLIATDGATELLGDGAPLRDGGAVRLGDLEADPRYAASPSALHRRLVSLGDVHGRLRDDTTVAVIRRREERAPCR